MCCAGMHLRGVLWPMFAVRSILARPCRHFTPSRQSKVGVVPKGPETFASCQQVSIEQAVRINNLEYASARDVGRGIIALAEHCRGGLLSAAASIAFHQSPSIAIITGFYIPDAVPPAPETDGLTASAQLADGLNRAGVPVRFVTDSNCEMASRIALETAGIEHPIIDLLAVEHSACRMQTLVESILNKWECLEPPLSHVLSIERAGPADDGVVYNMRGKDITHHTAPLHLLYERCTGVQRIGIGDGGNELGMASIPKDIIAHNVRCGARIACSISCDHMIVSGVSNWGAWSLMGALAILRPEWRQHLLESMTDEQSFNVLERTVFEGPAVDGVTRKQALSIDGLSWSDHIKVLAELRSIVQR